MGASLVILAFGWVASFFLRVVLRLAFILRNVTAALAAATGVNGVAQTASSMACFWLVSPSSARRCSYADTSTAANVEPPFGDKHGKSLARLERGAGDCLARRVLTNTGRCSCPFVASGVLARYARRVEFLLPATRL